jgi:hypothetical protein
MAPHGPVAAPPSIEHPRCGGTAADWIGVPDATGASADGAGPAAATVSFAIARAGAEGARRFVASQSKIAPAVRASSAAHSVS